MDAVGTSLVVAMGGRKINIYDIRRMDKATQERESSLRFMTRALACMPSGEGAFAILFRVLLLQTLNCARRFRVCVDRGKSCSRIL